MIIVKELKTKTKELTLNSYNEYTNSKFTKLLIKPSQSSNLLEQHALAEFFTSIT